MTKQRRPVPHSCGDHLTPQHMQPTRRALQLSLSARTSKHVLQGQVPVRYSALTGDCLLGVRPNGAAYTSHVTSCIKVTGTHPTRGTACRLFSNIPRVDINLWALPYACWHHCSPSAVGNSTGSPVALQLQFTCTLPCAALTRAAERFLIF
jgi:hypothetical protein